MKIVTKILHMRSICQRLRKEGKTLGLVPTMGALHQGHIKLIREARRENDIIILSIYVNPLQFGKEEDFKVYPKDIKGDKETAIKNRVDFLFLPETSGIYPSPSRTTVRVKDITERLCGASRPGHFEGVATVITKLFIIILPHRAYFGLKDYQQLAVIRQLNTDLHFGIDIKGIDTVREKDGLAVSSRNSYLAPEERDSALCLYAAIEKAKSMLEMGERSAKEIIEEIRKIILSEPLAVIDYITICDLTDFNDIETISDKALLALAVKIKKTRLIDNCILEVKTNK